MILKYFGYIFISIILVVKCYAEDEDKVVFDKEHQWNFYSGTFDFSDDGAKSTLFGIQHQNENLIRESFLLEMRIMTIPTITAMMTMMATMTTLLTIMTVLDWLTPMQFEEVCFIVLDPF